MYIKLDDEDWLDQANNMALGEVRKVPHKGCSSSNSLKISHEEDCKRAYCFKCQGRGYISNNVNTLNQLAIIDAHREATKQKNAGQNDILPVDLLHLQTNLSALSWLIGHGITYLEIDQYQIQFSPYLDRVFIPIYYKDVLINCIGRAINNTDSAKWWATKRVTIHYFRSNAIHTNDNDSCCVVEDIISCIKVGRHIDCYAIMGTSLSNKLYVALKNYLRVFVWTDGDDAGDKAYAALKSFCDTYYPEKEIIRIRTPNDPKLYDNKSIKERLM